MEFVWLSAASALWFGIHPGISGSSVRSRLVARIGEKRFGGLFSLLSLGSLIWLVLEYSRAPEALLWSATGALRALPLLIVPIAFVLLVGAFTVANPTALGGERVLSRPEPARGMLRITRHPFFWSVILWALAHIAANGDLASLLFFGSLLLTAAVGTVDIDRKRMHADASGWAKYAAVTSNSPFGAIASGRNRVVPRELVAPALIGLLLSALAFYFHASWFGVSPLP
jgi:uncharacterized membrane protein